MKRYLCWLVVLGMIAVPAVAAACWPMWGRQAYSPPVYSAPMYAQPVYVAPPVWQPAPQYVFPPPRIEAIPKTATPTPAPSAGMGTGTPAIMPQREPMVEPVRPAGGNDTATIPVPAPKKPTPVVTPDPVVLPIEPPKGTDLKFPTVEIPKNLLPREKLPPLELPKEPDPRTVPKVPAVGAPKEPIMPAIPVPAPAPGISEPLIPPPSVPLMPDSNKRDSLPSLTLPPDIPAKSDSISKSSPLMGSRQQELTVSVFPASGPEKVTGGGYRTVGFYNHTTRDLSLTIEGRAVKLPAKSYLHAQLSATFTWSHSERATIRETVPDGAGGLDVVFRN